MAKRTKTFWFYAWILLGTVRKKDQKNTKGRCEVWENLVLIKAVDARQALSKAEKLGKADSGDSRGTLTLDGKPARQIFLGLSNIGLVHEKISDGAEITWRLKRTSWGKAKLLARNREILLKELVRELHPYQN